MPTRSPILNEFSHPLISERAIDEPRPLKVIYIGAGISGILGAIEFRKRVPSIDLVIYDKNPEIGGTCQSDVPSHSYQLSFASSTSWSQFYASAPEILEYWKAVATKHDVTKHVHLQHTCIEARWNEDESKWKVKLLKLNASGGAELVEDTADVFITGTGTLNDWKWPEIKGLQDFKGALLHSANWDESFDPTGKTVAVIGGGSSGIKIVPALAPKVKAIDHYIRGKTWISSQYCEGVMKEKHGGLPDGNFNYTPEQKEAWRKDPSAYIQYRKLLEMGLQGNFATTRSDHPQHIEVKAAFEQSMRARLTAKPEIIDHVLPDFPPLCKRLTPGPGYLEALASPAVHVVSAPISHVSATGICTADGTHRPVDAIVCATGFETSPAAGFPIYGRDGANLRSKYAAPHPRTYLGLCTDGFPNFLQSLGPNSFQGAGSLLIMMEQAHRWMAQVLERLAAGNVRTFEPRRAAVDMFTGFCRAWFKRTVFTANCTSWYKTAAPGASAEERKRGRVTGLWPGSSVHGVRALQRVRWEDFDLEYCDGNAFGWFGNGWTVADQERDPEGLTWYLNNGGFLNGGCSNGGSLNGNSLSGEAGRSI
ncbi:putative flavin-binding monooxygenase protein [Neofusicoccum parvum UCRNP2]|uniref:Putative flavin-binding monooxygenase protein n=1 Tax=Botryosphaeria parva (strain UCR-NP2) TaxID=1287680 RepID=R1EHU7_BOTPV|nr:putative flavin-binding monooxygenase protein [Neofusicoccum parvum UCRNP2]